MTHDYNKDLVLAGHFAVFTRLLCRPLLMSFASLQHEIESLDNNHEAERPKTVKVREEYSKNTSMLFVSRQLVRLSQRALIFGGKFTRMS